MRLICILATISLLVSSVSAECRDKSCMPDSYEFGNDAQFTFYYDNGIGDDTYCQNGRSTVVIWHCEQDERYAEMYGQQISQCSYQIDVYANAIC